MPGPLGRPHDDGVRRPPVSRALGGLALTAAVAGLPVGVAHAEDGLAPGGSWSTTVSLPASWAGQADRLGVTVLALDQGENGCLAPEVAAGDTTCTADGGELAAQVEVTAEAGRYEAGSCRTLSDPAALDLGGGRVARVDVAGPECLVLTFAFPDGEDDDLAQSDTLALSLGLVASGPGGALGGESLPAESDRPDVAAGAGGTTSQVDLGAAPVAAGTQGVDRGSSTARPADAAALVAPGPDTVGTATVDVAVGGDDGVVRATAAGSVFDAPLALGALFVGASVLFWALFVLVRRRRQDQVR